MILSCQNICKSFGEKVILQDASFHIEDREKAALIGNNGAGKTTLFRLMLDLLKADNGFVRIGETEVSSSEAWKETTGAYLDESFLIDYLTPEEYFYFVGRMCNLNRQTVNERLAVYERFMNDEILGQKKLIRNLSAGNKQKIGILAALLNQPELIILDEPFNFLDPSSQSALKQLLVAYNQSTGATILVSSHNLNHTTDISTRIALLEHGKLIRDLDNSDGSAGNELETYFAV